MRRLSGFRGELRCEPGPLFPSRRVKIVATLYFFGEIISFHFLIRKLFAGYEEYVGTSIMAMFKEDGFVRVSSVLLGEKALRLITDSYNCFVSCICFTIYAVVVRER